MALKATEEVKTHQPGLSVRIQADCPEEFMAAVTNLVSKGTGFPAIHNDSVGYQMLINAGYEPEDARDWNNCGCVVPHYRKTGEWTAAVNVNFGSALEYALNEGKSRMTGEQMGLPEKPSREFVSYEEVEKAFYRQFANLCKHSVIATIEAQKLHQEMVPRPFLSSCIESCLETGKDLSQGGAKYNVGPVITGIGLAVASNSLAVIKKLVFEDRETTMEELDRALSADWEGYEELRKKAREVPKYGNDDDYVDEIAIKIGKAGITRRSISIRMYLDRPLTRRLWESQTIFRWEESWRRLPADGKTASRPAKGYPPMWAVTSQHRWQPCGRRPKSTREIHSGGTLLNLRLNHELVATRRGQANLGAMIQAFFALGAFHVQFNTLSSEVLRRAQEKPEDYKDLLVRVAGYSTQFVNLSKSMQDAIIARTEHAEF